MYKKIIQHTLRLYFCAYDSNNEEISDLRLLEGIRDGAVLKKTKCVFLYIARYLEYRKKIVDSRMTSRTYKIYYVLTSIQRKFKKKKAFTNLYTRSDQIMLS